MVFSFKKPRLQVSNTYWLGLLHSERLALQPTTEFNLPSNSLVVWRIPNGVMRHPASVPAVSRVILLAHHLVGRVRVRPRAGRPFR